MLRFGVIGMTEGNGHPFSWSAIINGYNQSNFEELCPYAGILDYLSKEPESSFGIPEVKVTHVCCDCREDAERVSSCSNVPYVVEKPEEMIGQVDAVLIATDIGVEHVERAFPFVEANLPVFIDKPLCVNKKDLIIFKNWIEHEGKKILSSSALRYSKEFIPYHLSTNNLGELRYVSMTMSKKWETYGIHALEAIYPILGPGFKTIRNLGDVSRNIVHMTHESGVDIVVACVKDMQYGGPIHLAGTKGHAVVHSSDTFFAFKKQLESFVEYVRTGISPFPFSETEELMRLVIGAIESREQNGKIVDIQW